MPCNAGANSEFTPLPLTMYAKRFAGIKQDLVAAVGEFVGTTMFLFLAMGATKSDSYSRTSSQTQTTGNVSLSNQDILFVATAFGLSLIVCAWVFYRITGGLFNPAVTLALWLVGAVPSIRSGMLIVAQILGGIAGSGLVTALTPGNSAASFATTISTVSVTQGLFLEMFLTAMLIFAVLMLAAEKHKATYLAPIGIGLTLFACEMFGVLWTGGSLNPARSFGPAVVLGHFDSYHWIYWVGPFLGAILAVAFYLALKRFNYTTIVFGQDSDNEKSVSTPVFSRFIHRAGWHRHQDKVEKQPTTTAVAAPTTTATTLPEDAVVLDVHPELERLGFRPEMTRGRHVTESGTDVMIVHPGTQDVGSIGPPGSSTSGLAIFTGVTKVLPFENDQSQHHDTHLD